MLFDALAPSSALQLIGFTDVDAFRPIARPAPRVVAHSARDPPVDHQAQVRETTDRWKPKGDCMAVMQVQEIRGKLPEQASQSRHGERVVAGAEVEGMNLEAVVVARPFEELALGAGHE